MTNILEDCGPWPFSLATSGAYGTCTQPENWNCTGLPGGSAVKGSPCQCRRRQFHPWVGKIPWRRNWQPHSSILAWSIPWMRGTCGLQSMRSRRVRHNQASKLTRQNQASKQASARV